MPMTQATFPKPIEAVAQPSFSDCSGEDDALRTLMERVRGGECGAFQELYELTVGRSQNQLCEGYRGQFMNVRQEDFQDAEPFCSQRTPVVVHPIPFCLLGKAAGARQLLTLRRGHRRGEGIAERLCGGERSDALLFRISGRSQLGCLTDIAGVKIGFQLSAQRRPQAMSEALQTVGRETRSELIEIAEPGLVEVHEPFESLSDARKEGGRSRR